MKCPNCQNTILWLRIFGVSPGGPIQCPSCEQSVRKKRGLANCLVMLIGVLLILAPMNITSLSMAIQGFNKWYFGLVITIWLYLDAKTRTLY